MSIKNNPMALGLANQQLGYQPLGSKLFNQPSIGFGSS